MKKIKNKEASSAKVDVIDENESNEPSNIKVDEVETNKCDKTSEVTSHEIPEGESDEVPPECDSTAGVKQVTKTPEPSSDTLL